MAKRFWDPRTSQLGELPNTLLVSQDAPGIMACPHWHAQVEVNFLYRGAVEYRMHGHTVRLAAGDLALFWGGLPHQLTDASEDAQYIAIHLPLIHFFRLRLPAALTDKLIHGTTLVTAERDATDQQTFMRWATYMSAQNDAQRLHAIDELLLRIDRMQFEPYRLVEPAGLAEGGTNPLDLQGFHNIGSICAFISDNFREDIDAVAIASSADIHPKYAMSVFKKSTGMTLNEYVNLLRLSYAQAKLLSDNDNVLRIAMDSGFGSLSAFNKSFRKISGMSPSDYRREARMRPAVN